MNYTQNYQLCLWDEDDRILMDDFNADNAKIDGALAAHDGKLNWLGNCRIETGSYVGTGEYGDDHFFSLTLSGPPIAILICGPDSPAIFMKSGYGARFQHNNDVVQNVETSGNTISWSHPTSPGPIMNAQGYTYYYLAFVEGV